MEELLPQTTINWFPGHMAKTRRMIKESLSSVDLVIEVLDARIPFASKNPEIDKIIGNKPKLVLLSKSTLADPAVCKEWEGYYKEKGNNCIFCDFITGYNVKNIVPAIKDTVADLIKKYNEKGMSGRAVTAMVVGIPNVGKSTFINTLCGGKKAKAENRPGVTKAKQWLKSDYGVDLLDMPGVLWPKFEDQTVGQSLALTGAIKDEILDIEELAVILCSRLKKLYPELLCSRFKMTDKELEDCESGYEILLLLGKKRGCLVSGGEIDETRIANILIEEFRSAKIGKISLERP